jgi:hypothetical protein
LAATLLTLTACSKSGQTGPAVDGGVVNTPIRYQGAPPPAVQLRAAAKPAPEMAAAAAADDATDSANAPSAQGIEITAPQLAYDYTWGLAAPPDGVRALKARHEAACNAAGPTQCQVVSAEVNEQGPDSVTASLELRAAPAWLKTFRDGLAGEAKKAGGRVTKTAVESEDLSRPIVDTDAQLRAKLVLRDRLQAILAAHPGKVADLLTAERELGTVQGEIDAAKSELAMMRTRVATSKVTIEYQSEGVLAPRGLFSPLRGAVDDFLGLAVRTLAFMVSALAVLIPWGLLIGGLLWLFRKRLPKFRRGRKEPPAT